MSCLAILHTDNFSCIECGCDYITHLIDNNLINLNLRCVIVTIIVKINYSQHDALCSDALYEMKNATFDLVFRTTMV